MLGLTVERQRDKEFLGKLLELEKQNNASLLRFREEYEKIIKGDGADLAVSSNFVIKFIEFQNQINQTGVQALDNVKHGRASMGFGFATLFCILLLMWWNQMTCCCRKADER
jgi:hypothetical protein